MQPEPEEQPAAAEARDETGTPGLPGDAAPAAPEVPSSEGAALSGETPPDPRDAETEEGDSAGPAERGEAEAELPPSREAIRIAEALVFASATPVTAARLAPLLPQGISATAVLAALGAEYAGRGVTLSHVAGGYAFRTAEDLAPALTRVVEMPRRLPRVAMEALAIIAWHQPVTRAEIEEIRGTALSQTTLELLLENGLVAPRGKKEAPGRPTLWATTPRFLEQFGLASLRDLPKREELLPEPGLPLPEQPAPPG
ncbi:SMC-Scp complex subunit ScpB [Roseomonas sp. SSH11]|uniref:SMC-Scp complex subunit ScpB n=1 Tax=Pararoseomonas baculiformis TaxID=2820812 RepID=A0ABS4AAD6_9PROT|nr:SMC-Scp complex subunit ScpB [Pararoseomonas baculiformis]MBP0443969.1 SMC-Scp complex subunit ScpB [Pararoseomonas baculiformis]